MKKVIFVVVLTVMCMSLFAMEFTPYGSARVGYWYEMLNEDWTETGESRMQMNMDLQGNSRFGVNFRSNDLTANVELGYRNAAGNAHIRHLWAKQSFGTWSLLAGLTEDGTNEAAGQVGFNDNMLRGGYGAVYSGRNPLVRFEMDNGFYAALIQPSTRHDPAGNEAGIDALIPKINLGWRFELGQVRLHPTFAFQMYQYNEDFGRRHDGDVMALLGAVTADYRTEAWTFRGHLNFGLNARHMGYDTPFGALWINNETEDLTSLGGFVTVGFDTSPTINVAAGVGFAQFDMDHDGEHWEDAHENLAFYLQGTFKIYDNLRVVPEFGMYMDGMQLDDVPTLMYFGAQLRFDF